MTITALLVTAAVLSALGYDGRTGTAATLAVAAVVCTAAALAGDTIQDLKCGALVGATPRALEIAQMIGVAVGRAARRMGALPPARGLHPRLGGAAGAAGQADGDAGRRASCTASCRGRCSGSASALAAIAELAGIASLPFAIGLYLPITTTASLIFGGLIADWRRGQRDDDPATLFASGLIAGDALLGVVFAGLIVAGWGGALALRTPAESGGSRPRSPSSPSPSSPGRSADMPAAAPRREDQRSRIPTTVETPGANSMAPPPSAC